MTEIEESLQEVRQQLAKLRATQEWVERFTGTLKDEPAFDDATAFGRALRSGDIPGEGDEP